MSARMLGALTLALALTGCASEPKYACGVPSGVTCHGPDATINNGDLRTLKVHEIPEKLAAQKFAFSVIDVSNTAPGQSPRSSDAIGGGRTSSAR